MVNSIRATVTVAALALAAAVVSQPAAGQDLAVGTWTGTVRNVPPRNPQPRPVSLIVKKGPDPHWRWRGGSKEVLGIVFRVQQNASEVSDITLADGRLSYAFTPAEQDQRIQCNLKRQNDGNYEGECKGGDWGIRLITLNPPEPDAVK